MVFNRDALRFSNAVKGNLEKALSDRLAGKGKRQRLTPISPVSHAEIEQWSADNGLVLDAVAGIRVFQDYLRQPLPRPQKRKRCWHWRSSTVAMTPLAAGALPALYLN